MTQTLRIAIVGLGAMGMSAAAALVESPWAEVAAAVDTDVAKTGKPLSDFVENAPSGVTVEASIDCLQNAAVDAAIVTTSSRIGECAAVIEFLVGAGINVVTLCEELGYPWASHDALARRLDAAAKSGEASILATGCNPGFAMDTLPLLLSGLTLGVQRVEIERSADVSGYGQAAEKMGLGLTLDEFALKIEQDAIVGHVGFRESIDAVVTILGLPADSIEIDAVEPAVVTSKKRVGRFATLPAGTVAVVLHRARAIAAGYVVVEVSEHFGYFDSSDPVVLRDRCVVTGLDQTIEVVAPRGYDSRQSTLALLVNCVPAVVQAGPGLQTMLDLPVRSVASKGGFAYPREGLSRPPARSRQHVPAASGSDS